MIARRYGIRSDTVLLRRPGFGLAVAGGRAQPRGGRGFAEGAEAGLAALDALAGERQLAGYGYFAAARANFLRRLGRVAEARSAYEEALALTGNTVERTFLAARARMPDGRWCPSPHDAPGAAVPRLPGMRAVQITSFGGPEVMDVVELPDPVPGDGEVLHEVSSSGVNFAHTHHRPSLE